MAKLCRLCCPCFFSDPEDTGEKPWDHAIPGLDDQSKPRRSVYKPSQGRNQVSSAEKTPLVGSRDAKDQSARNIESRFEEIRKRNLGGLSSVKRTTSPRQSSERLGTIRLSVFYLVPSETLRVNVWKARGLKAADFDGFSDPYVKLYILPKDAHSSDRKTQTKEHTLDPVWDEKFSFQIPHDEIKSKSLEVSVYDNDLGATDDFLGQVIIDLSLVKHLNHIEKVHTADLHVVWHHLTKQSKGDLYIEITSEDSKDDPQESILVCQVVKARNLLPMDSGTKSSDPFVKGKLLVRGERNHRAKFTTTHVSESLNPVWDHKEVMKIPTTELTKATLKVKVEDRDGFTSDTIGRIDFKLDQLPIKGWFALQE